MLLRPSIKLRQKALDLLARREHSQLELQQKLLLRGFAADEIEILLVELSAADLLSDQRYTENYVQRRTSRGYGPKRISEELRQRGITHQPDLLLDEENDYWYQQLYRLWSKKFANLPKEPKEYRRQMNFLLYRGFSLKHAKQLFKESSESIES